MTIRSGSTRRVAVAASLGISLLVAPASGLGSMVGVEAVAGATTSTDGIAERQNQPVTSLPVGEGDAVSGSEGVPGGETVTDDSGSARPSGRSSRGLFKILGALAVGAVGLFRKKLIPLFAGKGGAPDPDPAGDGWPADDTAPAALAFADGDPSSHAPNTQPGSGQPHATAVTPPPNPFANVSPVEPAPTPAVETSPVVAETTAAPTPTAQPTPAGWFSDPNDSTMLRYWDGAAWTTHQHPANG